MLLLRRTARGASRVAIVAAAMVIGAFAALFAADFEAGEVVAVQQAGFCLRGELDFAAVTSQINWDDGVGWGEVG